MYCVYVETSYRVSTTLTLCCVCVSVLFSVDLFRISVFFHAPSNQMNTELNWKLPGINIKWENCNISSFYRIIRQSNFSLFGSRAYG